MRTVSRYTITRAEAILKLFIFFKEMIVKNYTTAVALMG